MFNPNLPDLPHAALFHSTSDQATADPTISLASSEFRPGDRRGADHLSRVSRIASPPPVSSATATFAMTFSSSMSVVEYYLLKRFPIPYALYFVAVATVAAFVGQHVVRKLIIVLGRASLIIFILASTILISAISLGGVGVSNMIGKIQRGEYMGFENLCKYDA